MAIRQEKRKDGESAKEFRQRRTNKCEEAKKNLPPPSSSDPISYNYRNSENIQHKPFKCVDGTIKKLNHHSGKVEISGEQSNLRQHRRNIIENFGGSQKAAEESGYVFLPDGKILQPKYDTGNITDKDVKVVKAELEKVGRIINPGEIRKENIGKDPITGKPALLDHSGVVITKRNDDNDNKNSQTNDLTSTSETRKDRRSRLVTEYKDEAGKGFMYKNRAKIDRAEKEIAAIDEAIKVEKEAKKTDDGWTLKATFEIECPEVNLTEQDWQNITQDFDKVKNEFIKKLIKNYLPIQLSLSVIAKLRRDDPQNLLTNYTQIAKEFYANSESETLKAALAQPSIPLVFRSLLNKDFKLAIASLPKIRYKILNDFMVMFESAEQNDFELSNPTKKILNCYLGRFATKGAKFYRMIKNGS